MTRYSPFWYPSAGNPDAGDAKSSLKSVVGVPAGRVPLGVGTGVPPARVGAGFVFAFVGTVSRKSRPAPVTFSPRLLPFGGLAWWMRYARIVSGVASGNACL